MLAKWRKPGWSLLCFTAVVNLVSCRTIDPKVKYEIYQGVEDTDAGVQIATLSANERHKSSPVRVVFREKDGSIWTFAPVSKDPRHWEVTKEFPGRDKVKIPLRMIYDEPAQPKASWVGDEENMEPGS